jgi:hypothetical protein
MILTKINDMENNKQLTLFDVDANLTNSERYALFMREHRPPFATNKERVGLINDAIKAKYGYDIKEICRQAKEKYDRAQRAKQVNAMQIPSIKHLMKP